jgi:hypothetical protein
MNPDPLLFSPDDAAWQMAVVGFDHQREALGNPDRRAHLERSAGFGKITDRAINGGAAAKRNLARFQQPPPWCCSVLVHQLDLRLNTEVFDRGGYYPVKVCSCPDTTKGGGSPQRCSTPSSGPATRPRPPSLDRIGRVVEPRRRGVAAHHELIDQRLVLRCEAIVDRLQVIVPLLLGARACDHG